MLHLKRDCHWLNTLSDPKLELLTGRDCGIEVRLSFEMEDSESVIVQGMEIMLPSAPKWTAA
jgi:hypothetical protein